jgi:hypothetical protein
MNEVIAFVSQYGEILVFAVVFAEQIGLPLPAVPILLVAGALAGAGKIDLTVVIVSPSSPVWLAIYSGMSWGADGADVR